MREEIQEPVHWKTPRLRPARHQKGQATRRRRATTLCTESSKLTLDAVDAAFEDELLDSADQQTHRVDSVCTNPSSQDEVVEKLSIQLAVLEAQCQHLQGLLNSAKA